MSTYRPYVLTIAGFDPCGGAGLLADIKAFESHNVQGLAVQTANTLQTEDSFKEVIWTNEQVVLDQLTLLLNRYKISIAKIGLIKNKGQLDQVTTLLREHSPSIKIVWDPVIRASAGFDFHSGEEWTGLEEISKRLTLITPNTEEYERLKGITLHCAVLLKGGHRNDSADDVLIQGNEEKTFKTSRVANDKHGTGCVLSAAIVAGLANDLSLSTACEQAKEYTLDYIISTSGLLGKHHQKNLIKDYDL